MFSLIPKTLAINPLVGIDLSSLQRIDLSHNDIKMLPDFVYELKSLRELWISSNPISKLSNKISECEALEVLDIHNTKIEVSFFSVLCMFLLESV